MADRIENATAELEVAKLRIQEALVRLAVNDLGLAKMSSDEAVDHLKNAQHYMESPL